MAHGARTLARLDTVIERAIAPPPRICDTGIFSQQFLRRHTEFESMEAFCEACPCEPNTLGGVQSLSPGERNAFVDRTTDFETWAEMTSRAAVADLIALAGR